MEELKKILAEIQDYLVPILDTYEQAIYHYIFRHTYLEGKKDTYFSTRSADIGFGQGNATSKPSDRQKSKKLHNLEKKGAIKIVEKSYKGILVSIKLPIEIDGLIPNKIEKDIDIEELDFYNDKRLLPAILKREQYRCFYTGKKIDESSCYLDHVISQSVGGNNNYKNIVASCYDANSLKQDKATDDFLRMMYKEDLVSLKEFNEIKKKIKLLQSGELVPDKKIVKKLIES